MARDTDFIKPAQTAVVASPTAELIYAANLVASASPPREGPMPGWVSRQRLQLPLEASSALSRLEGFWWPLMGMVDFLCWNGLFRDPEAFFAALEALPHDQFFSVLFNDDLTVEEASAVLKAPELALTLGDRLSRFSSGTPEALKLAFQDPAGHRNALMALVRGSDTPLFQETLRSKTTEIDATVRILERRLRNEDPLTLAESLRGKPLKGPRSYSRMTFVPSLLIGHEHIQSWGNDHGIFFLRVGAATLAGPTQTGTELAEFLKVLGDKSRMDILRLLCCGPSYGKELATSLGLTTATVSRHLDQLKAAGLVREDKADSNNVKQLRYVPESLETQLDRLTNYLLHS